jgi:probable H4MPT-linked C1 transfer pathway protein
MHTLIGWDIGGAHLKAARADNGVIIKAAQIASPLWLGLEELDRAFAAAQDEIGTAAIHAITMTGELCDAFATREEGVAGLAEIATRRLSPGRAFFYAGRAGFVEMAKVGAHTQEIASANWHASAALSGLRAPEALFIDMGSTTTDIIPLAGGVPAAQGSSDAQRLAHGELVYTGLVRTFLMAGPKLVPFNGAWTPLMNEWFASTADVHRILGQLPDGADQMEPPDGRDKTVSASRARLARMIGRDAAEADDEAWERLARSFAEAQMREIMDAAALVVSRGVIGPRAPVIGAGCGREIVRAMSARMERPYLAFDELIEAAPEARSKASDCAGACAMALIGARQLSL